jgi:hypothetical protein
MPSGEAAPAPKTLLLSDGSARFFADANISADAPEEIIREIQPDA